MKFKTLKELLTHAKTLGWEVVQNGSDEVSLENEEYINYLNEEYRDYRWFTMLSGEVVGENGLGIVQDIVSLD